MPKYLVALAVGGLMECPEITYEDYQEIEADSAEEACEIYNAKNNCSFFYGKVICQINDCRMHDKESYKTEIYQVKSLGEKIGYGNLMDIASALWAKDLNDRGSSESAALYPVLIRDMKDGFLKYDIIKERICKIALFKELGIWGDNSG